MPRDYAEIRRTAAWREFGRRHYRWYVYGAAARAAAGPVALLAAAGGLVWAWTSVDRRVLAASALLFGGVLLIGLGVYHLSGRAIAARGAGRWRLLSPAVGGAAVLLLVFAAGAWLTHA